MSADLNLFFEALAARAYKENDLSDVTYAMCQSDSVFKKFFLDFFFPNANLSAEDAIFEREHSANNGRPDFWIRVNNTTYIVEVKIWDGSHHFGQYKEMLKKENNCKEDGAWQYLGYITNYELKHDSVPVKTWKDMHEKLKLKNGFDDPIIIAYMSYVKSVCGFETCNIDNFEFNPEDFKYIQTLCQEIDKCVDDDKNKKIKAYNCSVNFKTKCWMGRHFELKDFKDGKSIWGFLGVTYKDEIANICVSFRDQSGWAKLLCDQYRKEIEKCKDSAFTYKDSHLYFYMREKNETIEAFFNAVLATVKGSEKWDGERQQFPKLIAMKKMPLYLEQTFFNVTKDDYTVCLAEDQKDSEAPSLYCGRYFEIVPTKSSDSLREIVRGWVGAFFCQKEEKWKFIIQIWDGRKYETKGTYDEGDCHMSLIKNWFEKCIEDFWKKL